MSKIVILESLGIPESLLERLEEPFLAQGHTFTSYEKCTDKDVLVKELAGADIAVIANMPFGNEVIREADALQYIDVAFTGVDHVGLEACKEKGIKVSNASGYSNEAVAELTLGMMLSIARNMRAIEDRARHGGTKAGLIGTELCGKTVGIIGLGKIGTRTAALCHAFGCEILTHNRTYHEDAASYVEQVSLDVLLEKSDYVVLHCPLNNETKGLIDRYALHKMKKTSVLINAARGGVVCTNDLASALQDETIAYAGIDVFDQEPPLSKEEPLLHCPHCLVTPHAAFATEESMCQRAEIVFDNLRAYLDGKQKNIIL